MKTSIPSGEEWARKPQSVDVKAKAQTGTSCSFCWFVLAIYPSLKGMTEKDHETYREHLKKAHGLMENISS